MKLPMRRGVAAGFLAIAVTLAASVPASSADVLLSVPLRAQEHDQWCWAGSSNAVLAYYGSGVNQCTTVNWAFGRTDCCGNASFSWSHACNYWNYMSGNSAYGNPNGSLQGIMANWGVNSTLLQSALSQGTSVAEIDAGRPFVIRFGWSGGGGHFLVGYGYDQGGAYLDYMDPWPGNGYTKSLYSWTVSASDHSWTHSLQLTTPPDTGLPVVSISATDATATEAGPTTGLFTVSRTKSTAAALAVNYTVGGTATAGGDYVPLSGSVTIGAGLSSATIPLTPLNDTDVESPETVVATLSATAAYTVGTPASARVTISSDDSQPKVQFSLAASSGPELTTPAVIDVVLSAVSSQTVIVHYATTNGTAVAGSDYTTPTSGTLTFEPGVTTQSINVIITGDTAVEPNETFAVTLSAPVNATLGAVTWHTRTIVNDDFRGSIRLSSATSVVGEAGGEVAITVMRTGGSSGPVGVSYATANGTAAAGSDYAAGNGKVAWADGEAGSKNITVPISEDFRDEPDETFTVRLSTPTGGATLAVPNSGTVTIMDDDDPPTVQFNLAEASGAESTTPAVMTVTLSAASSRTVTVSYATANGTARSGSDYAARSGILTFAPGVTSQTISVPIVNDTTAETPADESFTVKLTTPVNATLLDGAQVHTYTIKDEDLHGAIKLSSAVYSLGETGLAVTITAVRIGGSGAAGGQYSTEDGTATAADDYEPVTGTLSWAEGDRTNKSFTVPIANDTLDEMNETFTVKLTALPDDAILGSPASGTVTIVDEDPAPTVQFNQLKTSRVESSTTAVLNVTLSGASGKTVTVKYATADGTAVAGSDYIASSGILTFSPGVTIQQVTVPIINDTVVEPDENFSVTLQSPVNATLGAIARHTRVIKNDDFAAPALAQRQFSVAPNDFDGDGRSDCGIYAATQGLWQLRLSTGGELSDRLGAAGAAPVTGDFDGDGRSDYGVYTAATGLWNLRESTVGDVTDTLGAAGTVPVTGDFDGDGRCDYGVFDSDSGLWRLRLSAKGDVTLHFGSAGAVPLTGDFDGDGVSDCGCFTPATGRCEIALSSGGLRTETFGDAGAIPIVGDFDGDGTADLGGYSPTTPGEEGVRLASPGSWQIMQSSAGFRTETFGDAEAVPIGGATR